MTDQTINDLDATASQLAEQVHTRLLRAGSSADHDHVAQLVRTVAPLIGAHALEAVVAEVLAKATGLGPLDPLLGDPEVTEVMVGGPGPGRVWVERDGRIHTTPLALDGPTIEHLIEKVVGPLGLRVDRASPMVDARLPDGSRVNAVLPPVAIDGPCLTIRRFGARGVPLSAFCPADVAAFLTEAIAERRNLVIAGGTSSGKTTLLNALAAEIPAGERVVTIEDAAELRLAGDHVIRLEARPANAEGAGLVTIRDLVRNALRMRPDRIVVGEVRDDAALDMVQAMNTGHEGSLSTCHANSPADALRRLEAMVVLGATGLPLAAVRDQVRASVDLVVQVARLPGGKRAIVEVAEVPLPDDQRPDPFAVRRLAGPDGLVRLPRRPPR